MKIKVYYRKSLKMSEGKLAAQVGHVCKELGRRPDPVMPCDAEDDIIIVLGVSDTKYKELSLQYQTEDLFWYQQIDNGMTEIAANTVTCFGHIEG